MRIKMRMQGGLYGTLELEEIDTEAPEIDVAPELQELLRAMGSDEMPGDGGVPKGVAEGRTEGQTYELRVALEDGSTRRLRFSEAAFEENPKLKALVDAVWKQAKPVAGD